MTRKPGRLGVFPLDPGRLGGSVAHPVIPSSFSLTDLAPVALWATNASGSCVAMGGAWERFTGRPVDAAAGDGWLAFVHDEDRVALKAAHLTANARREPFETEARFRRHDGHWHWVRIAGIPQTSGGVFRGFTGCALAAHRIREERGEAERDRLVLGLVTDLSWDALVVADAEGRVVRTNTAARRLFASRTGVEGEPLDRFVPRWRSLRGATGDPPTVDVHRGDGSVVTTRGRSGSHAAPDGETFVVALTRVDQLPPGEERRGMEPGRNAADLLHDLSNVVTALLAGCELARLGLPPDHPVVEEIDEIAENVRRARDLTQELKPPERGRGDPPPDPVAATPTDPPRERPSDPVLGRPGRRRRAENLPSEVLRGRTVLVVDDELAIRRSVRAAFEGAGAMVHDARHGADALLMWSDLRGRVDLVVTDLRMPEMGGEELAERLRMLRRDLPILFVSGYALDRRVRRRPGDGFLSKPFNGEELLEAASRVVSQPGAGA